MFSKYRVTRNLQRKGNFELILKCGFGKFPLYISFCSVTVALSWTIKKRVGLVKKKKKKSGGRQPARTGYILQRGHVFGFGVSFRLWVPVIGTDVIFPHLGQPVECRSGYNEPIPLFIKVPGSLFCSNWNSEYAHPQGNELWTRWRLGERGEEFGWWRITTMSVASAWRREPQLSILKNWKSSNSFKNNIP